MRKIDSFVKSPLVKIVRWFIKSMKRFGEFDGCSVKNSFEFIEKIEGLILGEGEILVSFDVSALFPSEPIASAMNIIRNHLVKHNVLNEQLNTCINVAEICIPHNCIQFRDDWYKCYLGASMGNPMSSLVSEAFLTNFESTLKEQGILPRCRHGS